MGEHVDLTGKIIGNWKVLEEDHIDKHHNYIYRCECQCEHHTIRLKSKRQMEQRPHCKKCGQRPTSYLGQTFGNLLVTSNPYNKNGHLYCDCICLCEKHTALSKRIDALTAGIGLHCGCQKGSRKGESRSRLFGIWAGMNYRCSEKQVKSHSYYNYYKRGIRVCDAWKDDENGFEIFKKWAYDNGYNDSLTIDRIDVNGNYCPDNCRWIPMKEQARNTTRTVYVEFLGKFEKAIDLAEQYGVQTSTIIRRYRNGYKNYDLIAKINLDNTSGHVGVAKNSDGTKWRAYITINNKHIHLGTYNTFDEAVEAREKAEKYYK